MIRTELPQPPPQWLPAPTATAAQTAPAPTVAAPVSGPPPSAWPDEDYRGWAGL